MQGVDVNQDHYFGFGEIKSNQLITLNGTVKIKDNNERLKQRTT